MEEAKTKKGVVRVLCLHGFRTSGQILRQQIEARWPKEVLILRQQIEARWPKEVLQRLQLHCPNSPFPARGESGLDNFYQPPYFEWFSSSKSVFCPSAEYHNFEEALNYIEEYMVEHGPFDCILGFSQGATVAANAPGLQSRGLAFTRVPTINSLILISASDFGGFWAGRPKFAANAFSSLLRCPSLHFIGENDFLRDQNIALLQHFLDPVMILQHGHTIPKPDGAGVQKMIRFLDKISEMPSTTSQRRSTHPTIPSALQLMFGC